MEYLNKFYYLLLKSQILYGQDMPISRTTKGFIYLDAGGDSIEVTYINDDLIHITSDIMNRQFDYEAFKMLLSGDDPESLDDGEFSDDEILNLDNEILMKQYVKSEEFFTHYRKVLFDLSAMLTNHPNKNLLSKINLLIENE